MSEQVPEYVLGESVAQTIEDAKEHGLSLVAVNVTLLEAVLEKLNAYAALKREFGEYAWKSEVIDTEMLMTELESLPGVSVEQFKADWLETFFDALLEAKP